MTCGNEQYCPNEAEGVAEAEAEEVPVEADDDTGVNVALGLDPRESEAVAAGVEEGVTLGVGLVDSSVRISALAAGKVTVK